ncbi:hypothetical protein [Pseudoalteromonas sp. T1lg10]|uniref:hypothetical protein n=1 Tax=Pseudoalteromonas sp. T1lg10 TaxID=2077093 RepID=UPI000CF6C88E|nr:hypothetical protein [Pseudoalteromonas sp. T1lg10]
MKKGLVIAFLAVLLFGCSKPIPSDRQAYVGVWESPEMRLLILADGTVDYKRLKNGGTTSINAALQEFEGDDFIVGFGFINTRFAVTQPPQEVDGQYQMVVDGVLLTKKM